MSDTHTAISVVAMATVFHFDIPKAILPSSYQPLMMELLDGCMMDAAMEV